MNATNANSLYNSPARRSADFARQRLKNFGTSLIAMGICFPLYYLGFFGGVEGPLQPDRLGETLAALGIARSHFLGLFLAALALSLLWSPIRDRRRRRTDPDAPAVKTGASGYAVAAVSLFCGWVVLFC